MTEEEFLLQDRIAKIESIIRKYGEENFYISFSGGKDSTVLHHLVDEALAGNKIPRVYSNTGIEYNYNIHIQRELDTLDKFFPNERKQCEIIWKPVYEEYRRIGYRNMRPLEWGRQTTIDEFLIEDTNEDK